MYPVAMVAYVTGHMGVTRWFMILIQKVLSLLWMLLCILEEKVRL